VAKVLLTVLLAALTVSVQVKHLGWRYVDSGEQVRQYERWLAGGAGDPWQYRVLSMVILDRMLFALHGLAVPHPYGIAFVAFRLVQNVAIFSLAGSFYRCLGFALRESALGLALLAWSTTHALYDSDLQFSTYTDVIVYLAASLLIARRRVAAYPLVAAVGAFNRETSGLVPMMLLATCFASHWSGRGAARQASATYHGLGELRRQRLLDVWRRLARHWRRARAVVGFDFLNEPLDIRNLVGFEHGAIYPYRTAARIVRARTQRQVVFLEPPVLRNVGARAHPEPVGDRDLVCAPHLYTTTFGLPTLQYPGDRAAITCDTVETTRATRRASTRG
jgi:hypothetical protein